MPWKAHSENHWPNNISKAIIHLSLYNLNPGFWVLTSPKYHWWALGWAVLSLSVISTTSLPWRLSDQESTYQYKRLGDVGLHQYKMFSDPVSAGSPKVGIPVNKLSSDRPWGHKKLDMIERLTFLLFTFSLSRKQKSLTI